MNNNQSTLQEATLSTKKDTPIELDGQKILFSKKVTLMPVKLEKSKNNK